MTSGAEQGGAFKVGDHVAIERIADGKVVAVAKVVRGSSRDYITETPYDQKGPNDMGRRRWRLNPPHAEIGVPREAKGTAVPCRIRTATETDIDLGVRIAAAHLAMRCLSGLRRSAEDVESRVHEAEQALEYERESLRRYRDGIRDAEDAIAAVPWIFGGAP